MRRLASIFRWLCLAAMCGAWPAQAGELSIEVALLDDGALEIRYTPPAGVTELRLLRHDAATLDFWRDQVRPSDDCARIDGSQVSLRSDARCRTASLRVEPRLMGRMATYEAALPMRDAGVLGWTGHYLMALPGHDLRWRWRAPGGGYVLHRGQIERPTVEEFVPADVVDAALKALESEPAWTRLGGDQYVYIGRAPTTTIPGGHLVHDPELDPQRLALIRQTLDSAMRSLGTAYRRWPDGPVGVVVTLAEAPGFQGDVTAGRMMSLRLSRQAAPNEPPAALQHFIDHEVAHWWNMGVFRSDEHQPWLHEGHADWVALLLTRQQQAVGLEAARARLEGALNACLAARGDRAAATLDTGHGRGDDPYACGMVLMWLAQAERRDDRSSGAPGPLLDRLTSLHVGDRSLDATAFAAWADRGPEGPMRHLLLDPGVPFASTVVEWFRTLGLGQAHPLPGSQALPAAVSQRLAEGLMQALMALDCGGSSGYWRGHDAFKLDDRLRCRNLRLGQEAMTLNGVALMGDPWRAWQVLAASCAPRAEAPVHPLTLGYREGPATGLACPSPLPSPPLTHWLQVDAQALEKLGL